MTRPAPIRMVPNRLPPLTKAQETRVRAFRKLYKNHGKVSVTRKGQVLGIVCISITTRKDVERWWYGPDGRPLNHVTEYQLFTVPDLAYNGPGNAIYQETGDN